MEKKIEDVSKPPVTPRRNSTSILYCQRMHAFWLTWVVTTSSCHLIPSKGSLVNHFGVGLGIQRQERSVSLYPQVNPSIHGIFSLQLSFRGMQRHRFFSSSHALTELLQNILVKQTCSGMHLQDEELGSRNVPTGHNTAGQMGGFVPARFAGEGGHLQVKGSRFFPSAQSAWGQRFFGHSHVLGSRALPSGHNDWMQTGGPSGHLHVFGSRGFPSGHNDWMHLGVSPGHRHVFGSRALPSSHIDWMQITPSSGHSHVLGSRGLPSGHTDWMQIGFSPGQPQVFGSRALPSGHNDCMQIGFSCGAGSLAS